jgi:type IV pilus assembly protein PilP
MMTIRTGSKPVLLVLLLALAGCGDSDIQELKQWMSDVKRQTPRATQKVSEPKKFTPFAYDNKSEIDPFNPEKLSAALAKQQSNSGSGLKPDLERRKEPLESYPLDTIKMVGSLQKAGLNYAILQADKAVFRAKAGNYLGQNFGMITRITDTEVDIKEIVRDASGEWTEREAKLELQENKK